MRSTISRENDEKIAVAVQKEVAVAVEQALAPYRSKIVEDKSSESGFESETLKSVIDPVKGTVLVVFHGNWLVINFNLALY